MKNVLRSLAVVIGLPTLIAALYFGLVAADIYVSQARFAIRSSAGVQAPSGLASLLGSTIAPGGAQDSMIVIDYLKSQDLLDELQARIPVRQHYISHEADVLSRLDEDATREEFLEYFRERLTVLNDSTSGVITVSAQAFEPKMAQQIAEEVIALGEQLVNTMSNRMEGDALATARAEVTRSAERLRRVSADISRFRESNDSLDPAIESSARLGLVSGIESKLIEVRAELSEKGAFMRDSSAEIVTLKNRVNALQRQLQLERSSLSGNDSGDMGQLIESYQPLALEQEITRQQYTSSLASLEIARLEAQRQKQYLVTFVAPSLPDEAVEPRRFKSVLTVMLYALLAYMIGGLMYSALRDHVGK